MVSIHGIRPYWEQRAIQLVPYILKRASYVFVRFVRDYARERERECDLSYVCVCVCTRCGVANSSYQRANRKFHICSNVACQSFLNFIRFRNYCDAMSLHSNSDIEFFFSVVS